MDDKIKGYLIGQARIEGAKITAHGGTRKGGAENTPRKPTTIWAGLGNRAGLHSYADTILREKWLKSGPRFVKKLDALPAGATVCVFDYRAINRDRGRWVCVRTFKV
jgi:hypothetical protein